MNNVARKPPVASYSALGYAGLLPQAFCLLLQADDVGLQWVASALGLAYAALILSFLGGVWWGLALASSRPQRWMFGLAVLPSLVGLAAFFPWTVGWTWPGPSLIVTGLCLLASPLVDWALADHIQLPKAWMRLRVHLSTGLGSMTIVLGVLALS